MYLFNNGMTREEYDWFMKGEPPGHQVMGNDYYGRNERIMLPDGNILLFCQREGFGKKRALMQPLSQCVCGQPLRQPRRKARRPKSDRS